MPLWRGSRSPPRRSPAKALPGQLLLPPRLARRVAACSLFVQLAVYIVFLCMCGATAAAAAARQQPYTITPLCALLLKNQDTHIHSTQYHIRTTPSARLYTFYMYTYARTEEFRHKVFFSRL